MATQRAESCARQWTRERHYILNSGLLQMSDIAFLNMLDDLGWYDEGGE